MPKQDDHGPEAFRCVGDEFIERTLRGQFRLWRLSYFRSLEASGGRRDELENAVLRRSGDHDLRFEDDNRRTEDALRGMGINLRGNGRGVVRNNTKMTTAEPDFLVLCCSLERPTNLQSDGRKAWIHILDLCELGERLMQRHRELIRGWAAPVEYVQREFDLFDQGDDPQPFRKRVRYREEKEIRLVFEGLVEGDYFDTDCPECADLMRLV